MHRNTTTPDAMVIVMVMPQRDVFQVRVRPGRADVETSGDFCSERDRSEFA